MLECLGNPPTHIPLKCWTSKANDPTKAHMFSFDSLWSAIKPVKYSLFTKEMNKCDVKSTKLIKIKQIKLCLIVKWNLSAKINYWVHFCA